ncbi:MULTISPECIES: DotU family type IV/VI secretion system protein [Burkholderia cepacia complex]|uniref:DotU family type IV/VI secretion system protein n=1 Tax=Burkholderia cepacia complex TaxID=87882 RepID=UPI00075B7C11|nr:DotU family type IV/VI secretion system protein [Burkholderia anthina]KVH12727.1 type IV secretion protein DotU [Burkholderia anthina]KVH15464.1 type IV secretion protein DotU [Burkholderia anthina]KVM88229.1 type IV secretion protein DotU [Burkholderia anthina]KVN64140.1 type IV secretion protein DotU [Burkholderia anthina]KVX37037.1 type IV secretion protein DotU [Burkholderia anthina]
MNAIVSTRHDSALLAREPSSGHAAGPSMRALLRDTALLVAQLSSGGEVDNPEGLRQQCARLVAQLATALDAQGVAADIRDDLLVAQCALIDETALRHLPAADKANWESRPLQVDRFGTHDAGTRIYERLEYRMREPSPNVDLLECYAAIFGLGFRGRYAARSGSSADAHEGEATRLALLAALVAQIDQLRPAVRPGFVTDRSNTRLIDRLRHLSPWAIAGTACVIAILAWFAWDRILDAELAQLVQTVKRP